MVNVRFFLFLIGLSLLLGLTETSRKAKAVEPAACPRWECKTVHAWWAGTKGNIQACFNVGGGEMDTTSEGHVDIFTGASTEKKDRVPNGKMDVWNYNACTPMCGKDANGKWQALQEVGRAGKRGTSVENVNRTACTSNDGKDGPKSSVSGNNNVDGNSPPGVVENPGGGGLGRGGP